MNRDHEEWTQVGKRKCVSPLEPGKEIADTMYKSQQRFSDSRKTSVDDVQVDSITRCSQSSMEDERPFNDDVEQESTNPTSIANLTQAQVLKLITTARTKHLSINTEISRAKITPEDFVYVANEIVNATSIYSEGIIDTVRRAIMSVKKYI